MPVVPAGGWRRQGGRGLPLAGSLRPRDRHDPQEALAATWTPFNFNERDPFHEWYALGLLV